MSYRPCFGNTHIGQGRNFSARFFSRQGNVMSPVILVIPAVVLLIAAGCDDSRTSTATAPQGFAIDKSYTKGPLTIHIRVDRDNITIADTLHVQLEAVLEPGYEMSLPVLSEFITDKNGLEVLDATDLPDELTAGDKHLYRRNYRLEPTRTGPCTIPAIKFIFQDKATSHPTGTISGKPITKSPKIYELYSEALSVEVTDLPADQQGKQLAEIKDVASLSWQPSGWWLVAGGTVLAGVLILLVRRLRRQKSTTQRRIYKAAHEIAWQRLRQLEEEHLIEKGLVEQFYYRISNILRCYIEDRFSLKAPERTTEEFLQELNETDTLSEAQKKILQQFLEHCDLVKFAVYRPSAAEINQTLEITRNFITSTQSDDRKIDVTAQERPARQTATTR